VGARVDPQMFGRRSCCGFPVVAAVYVFFTTVCAEESESKGLGLQNNHSWTAVAENPVLPSSCCSLKTLSCVNGSEVVGEPLELSDRMHGTPAA